MLFYMFIVNFQMFLERYRSRMFEKAGVIIIAENRNELILKYARMMGKIKLECSTVS